MRQALHIFPSDLTASLDFPEILEELRSRCSTLEAAEEIGQLVPSGAYDEVLSALRKADECLQLYLREFPLPN